MTYWSISSKIISENAIKLGYQVEIINKEKNLFYLSKANNKVLFKNIDCGINSALGLKVANDKELTYNILDDLGIRTAKSFYLNEDSLSSFNLKDTDLDFPLVVKPLDGAHGDGVTTNIQCNKDLESAINNALNFSKNIIIQEYILGEEYRLMFIEGKLTACINRIPPFVTGNGKNTIIELIDIENANSDRGEGYAKSLTKIKVDTELTNFLKNQDYGLETVIEINKMVQLRGNSNIGTGGIPNVIPISNVSSKIIEQCSKLSKILDLKIIAIDLLTRDITKSLEDTKGIILEIGATPGLGYGDENIDINVATKIITLAFNKYEK